MDNGGTTATSKGERLCRVERRKELGDNVGSAARCNLHGGMGRMVGLQRPTLQPAAGLYSGCPPCCCAWCCRAMLSML